MSKLLGRSAITGQCKTSNIAIRGLLSSFLLLRYRELDKELCAIERGHMRLDLVTYSMAIHAPLSLLVLLSFCVSFLSSCIGMSSLLKWRSRLACMCNRCSRSISAEITSGMSAVSPERERRTETHMDRVLEETETQRKRERADKQRLRHT